MCSYQQGMGTAEILAVIAIFFAVLGIWASWAFPLRLEARHRDGLERYFRILLKKAKPGIEALISECKSIAEQLKREEQKSIEATEIRARTIYFREISVE